MARCDSRNVRLYECGMFKTFIKVDDAAAMEERGDIEAMYEERPKGLHFIGYQLKSGKVSGSDKTNGSM
jgi:hypothetical protein